MDNHLTKARRTDNRAALILQIVLLFLMITLSALIGLIWFGGERLLFPPTPTATATAGLRLSPTADFRATLIVEDRATQAAYSTVAAVLGLSPLALPTKPLALATPITNVIPLPIVIGGEPGAPATAVASTGTGGNPEGNIINVALPVVVNDSILPTPTPTPIIFSELPTETPTETPTGTPLPLPSDTPTLLAPTETPTPAPTLYLVNSQKAIIVATPVATLRAGPSNLYGAVGTLANGTAVNLIGRDETGEWVVVCCFENVPRWLRQVYAPPKDNPLPAGVPTTTNPNDVRWLKVEIAPPTTVPILTPTPIPINSFPLYRHDRGNSGRIPKLPTWPLQQVWPSPNRAEQPLISPILAANDKVFVASDDNHLYALGGSEGNQQWRFNVGGKVRFAPALQDAYIYFTDDQGRIFGLQDLGNQYSLAWQTGISNGKPQSAVYVAGDRLYTIMRDQSLQDRLYAIDRFNGAILGNRASAGKMAPVFAIGNQLIYLGEPELRAYDSNDFSFVWANDEIKNLMAPPVFLLNGPNGLAELYVVDSVPEKGGGRLHALNANTGQNIWTTVIGRDMTGLAVSDIAIIVTGDNFVRAIPRQAGNATLWEQPISGQAVGGPLIDGNQLLIVTTNGNIQGFSLGGQPLGNIFAPAGVQVVGAPAVNGAYLYVPTNDSIVHAYQGQP